MNVHIFSSLHYLIFQATSSEASEKLESFKGLAASVQEMYTDLGLSLPKDFTEKLGKVQALEDSIRVREGTQAC